MSAFLLKSEEIERLFDAISVLHGQEEYARFFNDVCTISELQAMAQRFAVAELVARGATYNEIAEKTKCSSATVSRVTRAYNYGADGYKLALERLNESK